MKRIRRETLLEYIPEYKAFIPGIRKTFTALDVLELEEIPAKDRLWLVLRTEFIDPKILHKFACLCAERALSRIEHPDPRSVAGIEAKRKWMRGDISDEEMDAAWAAAWDAARDATVGPAEGAAAWAAVMNATWAAEGAAAWAAEGAAAMSSERAWQVAELKKLLKEAEA